MLRTKDLSWTEYAKYLVIRFVLWLIAKRSRYDGWHEIPSDDPLRYGAIASRKQFEEEWPYTKAMMNRRKLDDRLSVFCTSSSGQILSIEMTRTADKRAKVFLYLRTSKASYVLPKQLYVDLSTEDTFAVNGLRVECIIPNRRWRFSFNGLLKNTTTDKEEHVRFVFTGNNLIRLADLSSFHSNQLVALQLSRSPKFSLVSLLFNRNLISENLEEIDTIVQTYGFVGKVRTQADNENHSEEEFYSFGNKKRSHVKTSSSVESLGTFMAYSKYGVSVCLEIVQIENFSPSFVSGVLTYPSYTQCNIDFADLDIIKNGRLKEKFVIGSKGLHLLEIKIEDELDSTSLISKFNGENRERTLKSFRITFDDVEGHAVFIGPHGQRVEVSPPEVPEYVSNEAPDSMRKILRFDEKQCLNESLTGGKASSLAVLTTLANKSKKFSVANGLAVTTIAYAEFARNTQVSEAIEKLEKALQANNDEKLKAVCEETVKVIGAVSIPDSIKQDLDKTLRQIFENLEQIKFAVRSSACGEDSEDMSAAGQMETFLGVTGLENIYDAVAKCWASQFSFVAVQYRRRYGQLINCPMAVCVQEMVASEVSGVMFTVDPVTSNPKYVTITANYGLGESVVSAAADPDTFVIEKNTKKVVSSTIGAKKLQTILLAEGGTKDIIKTDGTQNESCLSDSQLKLLTEVASEVENYYSSQRDTEWAFAPDGGLFMLQARPVTSAHVLDTEFEFYHETDDGLMSEYDTASKANVGEVFGGAFSNLSQTSTCGPMMNTVDFSPDVFCRDFMFMKQNSQMFFAVGLWFGDPNKKDLMSTGMNYSMSGRLTTDENVKKSAQIKGKYTPKGTKPPPMGSLWSIIYQSDSYLNSSEEFVKNMKFTLDDCTNSRDMLLKILRNKKLQYRAMDCHGHQIFLGSFNNVMVLALLAHTEGDWTSNVFSDFAKMVASCNSLVSADVPLSLQKLVLQITEDFGSEFKELKPEEALEKLKTSQTKSSRLFTEFLENHGHRCMHEFDLFSRTWSMDPVPVVKTIQTMINCTTVEDRPDLTISQILDSLKIKVNPLKKLALRLLVSRVRRSVANRERGKSVLIYATHKYRLLFRQLADQMVKEGRLPEADLLFFLSPSEIYKLIETRSPKIVIRAGHRRRNAAKASKDIYPEYIFGFPVRPVNYEEESKAVGSRSMTGTPVSQGQIVGTARVILSLDDAHQIQKGDILITYATDIGWSPYFPLLSGIVTELGGLISHGAVVAREYGLPCIVAAHGATKMFRSGEQVSLDGTNGTLKTVE